jgi:hypothetical protein
VGAKMKIIIVTGIILYVIGVWGSGIIQDFAAVQKERQDRIEIILKGE